MTRLARVIAMMCAILLLAAPAPAQQATEQFIPYGKSPGISGVRSYTGMINQVDAGQRAIVAGEGGAARRFTITPRTRIWIDRSRQKATNLEGRFEDLRAGQRIEVKPIDTGDSGSADWIKIAM